MDHRVGAFAPVEVVLQALGHGEDIFGAARLNELSFPTHGLPEGQTLRIGFRPYAVQISKNLQEHPQLAVIRHVYFLGVQLRLELETPSGLVLRTRIVKDEFIRQGLEQGSSVSFQIREYREQ